MKKYLPTNDLLFKKTFASVGNEAILIGFLQDVLQIEIESIQVKQPYHIDQFKNALNPDELLKTEVDLLATSSSGEVFTVEMQRLSHDYFVERTLFYGAQEYTENYKGQELDRDGRRDSRPNYYSSLRKVYSISILEGTLFKADNRVIRHFKYLDAETYDSLEVLGVQTIDLVYFQLNGEVYDHLNVKYWKDFFLKSSVSDSAPDYIQLACEGIRFVNLSQEEREMAETISKREADYWAQISSAEDRGIERGIELGLEEGMRKIIFQFYRSGMSIETIADHTDFSVDEVREILDRE